MERKAARRSAQAVHASRHAVEAAIRPSASQEAERRSGSGLNERMVSHLVLLQPRSDLSAVERRGFIDAFEQALTTIPSVRNVRIGDRIVHGAGYEQSAPAMEYVAVIDFDDLAGLQAYLRHPAHEQLGAWFGRSVTASFVYDFEVGGVEVLRTGRFL